MRRIPGPRLKDPVRQPVRLRHMTVHQAAGEQFVLRLLVAMAIVAALSTKI